MTVLLASFHTFVLGKARRAGAQAIFRTIREQRRRKLILLFLVAQVAGFVLFPGQPAAGQAPCPQPCNPPVDPSRARTLEIDAVTRQTRGKTVYGKRDQVRVLILNKNPFRYGYKTEINEEPISEPALTEFLKLLGGVVTEVLPKDVQQAVKADVRELRLDCSPDKPTPEAAQELLSVIRAFDGKLLVKSAELEAALKKLAADHTPIREEYTLAREALLKAEATCCNTLYGTAEALRQRLESYKPETQLDNFHNGVRAWEELARAQQGLVDEFQRENRQCQNSPLLLGYHARAAMVVEKAVPDFLDNVQKMRDDKKNFDAMRKAIQKAFSDPNAFYEVVWIGGYDRPTDVTLTVTRTDMETGKPEQYIVKKLNFGGGPRFALAGGLAFSPLDKREFQRIQGFERDRDGNLVLVSGQPNFTTIVGLRQDSNTRITPLVMLHGRLAYGEPWGIESGLGLHLSAGVTAQSDNQGTDAEYLVGASLSFLEERVFVTVGNYGGRKQNLEGSLFLGAPVPTDLAEIPVRKDLHWNLGLAVTYRIK